MTRGIIMFAFNSTTTNYYKMAIATSHRAHKFLNLPITIITDENSRSIDITPPFVNTITTIPDKSNWRNKSEWINKNRYSAYNMSPYDETLLIDTDYMINSTKLLQLFDLNSEFLCHNNSKYMFSDHPTEKLYKNSYINTLWATIILFKKTPLVKQIFSMMEMIQNNNEHYSNIYKFNSLMYRNDYALTIALKTALGHLENKQHYIPWKLLHISPQDKVTRINDITYKITNKSNNTTTWIDITELDFHMLNKQNFMELL